MNSEALLRAMVMCSASYGNRFSLPSKAGERRVFMDVWAQMLQDVSDEDGLKAFEVHISLESWPPAIADIRKLVQAQHVLSGLDAWLEVEAAARRVGYQNGEIPEFSSPLVRGAAIFTGWNRICYADENDPRPKHEFIEAYKQLVCEDAAERTCEPQKQLGP